MFTSFVET